MSPPSSTLSEDDRRYLTDRLRLDAGIALSPEQAYMLDLRLAPVVRKHGLASPAALVSQLKMKVNAALAQDVIDAFCTNETSFFRNEEVFEALAGDVLPALMAARKTSRALTIWCAASSSGQEVWSVAILLRDRFPELREWKVKILATDVSQAMVTRTRAGVYSEQELGRGMPDRLRSTYFQRHAGGWEVRPDLRSLVEARRANLLAPQLVAGSVDLVLLRNVLIYFDADGKRAALGVVHTALASDGAFLVGAGEQVRDPRFAVRTRGAAFVYLRQGTHATPVHGGRATT